VETTLQWMAQGDGTFDRLATTELVMLEKTRRSLLKQIEARHDEALARLYDNEAPLVAARLRARGVSSQEIEDILQETFLAVWNQAGSFRGEGSVAAWVWVIARNQWISRTRSPAHRQFATDYVESAEGFDDPSMRIDLEVSLTEMSVPMREVFDAVAVRGLSVQEAAEELGLPEGTVKSRLHRARARLKENLNE
jgi:RNA polymerase sigma-70 factor, ECF subfamily